ncbi:MAG TPA: hypothetical protein VFB73_14455 [Chloroflexota bacterium]|nr:hypothetical protein [Chloroflexota bacterium]
MTRTRKRLARLLERLAAPPRRCTHTITTPLLFEAAVDTFLRWRPGPIAVGDCEVALVVPPTVERATATARLRWRGLVQRPPDRAAWLDGALEVELAAVAGGTRVTVTSAWDAVAEAAVGAVPAGASATAVEERDAPAPRVRVPRRLRDRVRWQATWHVVKAQWRQGRRLTAIADWLARAHPELRCSADVLADIVRAGEAGVLDAPNTPSC